MRVAVIVNRFPKITETFVLYQITGLIDREIEVDIYARHRGSDRINHQIVRKYNLLEKVRYFDDVPRNKPARFLNGAKYIFTQRSISCIGKVLRSCNIVKYGREAASLYLLSLLYSLRNVPKYDIIHCQFGNAAPFILNLRDIGILTGKLVTSFRGKDTGVYLAKNNMVYRELFKKGDLFLPVCDYLKWVLIENQCEANKISVLYSGIDIKKFQTAARLPDKHEALHIATIGRLVEKKGVLYGMQAIQKILKTGRKVRYTIIGDGVLKDDLNTYIENNALGEYIRIEGWKTHDEIIAMLRTTDILVAPSVTPENGDKEGIPNVLKEAMAMGIPVVSTNHGGIPELIKDRSNGFIVPERDVDALADRISYMVDHPQRRFEMGRAGKRYIKQYFNIEILNNRLVEYYKKILEAEFE